MRENLSFGFRPGHAQTSLFRFRDRLEKRHFARSKSKYDTFQQANNKGAGQTK